MNLLEKLAEAKENLTQVKAAVEAEEKSAEDLSEAIETVKTIQSQIKAADEAEALMKALETPKEEKAETPAVATSGKCAKCGADLPENAKFCLR